jgi:acetyl/propionyl-CoA carboxylase alpha subunit
MSTSPGQWPFDTVLIANRGEIALRVIRTVHALGLRAAVVFHAADRGSPAVTTADAAVEITGETPVAAYLDGDQIIEAAKQTGAGAIHPGYGFLSENADFARAVEAAGIAFVGPKPEQIELMGDKVRARGFVEKSGFPVAPSAIEDDNPDDFVERAHAVGAPLLIKPSAGGGGKGMRIVRDLAVLETEIATARSEGQRYFGDGRLYAERFVENPRHIEVQVLGDAHGNAVHVFERECSVQRRFQKIVEESPAPALSQAEREQISETAAGIARAIGYRGAGTVEFIYGKGEFFFLEMNTRLQVEHPVTEEVTGIDLVAQQLAIAAGDKLDLEQAAITTKGHAIELRIYAEDPAAGYLPTTGPILRLIPPTGEHVRWDGGVVEGGAVTAAFDPMIAKLIVWGEDREQAIARARRALEATVLLGCQTNTAFLRALMDHPDFVAGEIHTGYLDAHPEVAESQPPDTATVERLLAAAALSVRPIRDVVDSTPTLHAAIGAWSN